MPLSRTRVITAAIELIERNARDPISMEALATHLGCSLVTLYRCVPSTAALLDGVARAALSGVPAEAPGPGAPWTDQVASHARSFRRIARGRSRAVLLAASHSPSSAPAGWPLAPAIVAIRTSGLSDDDSVRLARALHWYVLGSLLAEADEEADADFDYGLGLLLRGATPVPER